jgi:hypothetical protein
MKHKTKTRGFDEASVATARLYQQTLEKSAPSVENLGLRRLLLLSLRIVQLAYEEGKNECS